MDNADGPRLTYTGDPSGERLAAAAPEGYEVQWAGPIVRLGGGWFALPLVKVAS